MSAPTPKSLRIPRRAQRGFTLLEMMTALTIVGILAALALPRLDVDSYKVNAAVRSITSSLTYLYGDRKSVV